MKLLLLSLLALSIVFGQEQEETAAVGGYEEIRVKDFMKSNEDISNFIIQALDESAGEDYRLWKINHVYQQVVSGTNTKLTADYVSKQDHNAYKRFEIIIYDQLWTNTRDIVSLTSTDLRVSQKAKKIEQFGNWKSSDKEQFLEQNKHIEDKLQQRIRTELEDNEIEIKSIVDIKEQFIAGRTYCIQLLMNNGQKLRAIVYQSPWSNNADIMQIQKLERFE